MKKSIYKGLKSKKCSFYSKVFVVVILTFVLLFNGVSRSYAIDLTDGLVGYWKLDGNALDSSGNGNNGTLYGNTSYTIGKLNEAGNFDGVGDYIDIGTGPSVVNTVSLWIYPTSTTDYMVNLTGTTDYISASSGTISATGFTSPTIYVNGVVSTTLSANTWQHIVVVTDTSENASNLDIGRIADVNYFTGKIDDVRIYNRVLSAVEVEELYRSTKNLVIGSDFNVAGPNPQLVPYNGSSAVNTSTGNVFSAIDFLYPSSSSFDKQLLNTPGVFGNAISFDGNDDSLRTNTITAGLVGWWKMDEDTNNTCSGGEDVCDISGNGNNGVETGTVATTNGKFGRARNFDGVDDYVAESSDNDILDPTEITLSAWIKPNIIQTGNFINKGDNIGYRFRVNVDGTLGFLDRGSTNNLSSSSKVHSGQWYHVVATGDSTGLKIYINGVLDNQNTIAYGGANTTYPLVFGRYYIYEYYSGVVDDVRIYNRALSPNEIQQLYNEDLKSLSNSSISLSAKVKPSSIGGLESGGTVLSKSDNYSLGVVGDDSGNNRSAFTTNAITSQLSGTVINDVYFYDTTKDTIDNSWRFDTTKSWYTETIDNTYANCNITTDDRCGTKYFPEKVYIVGANGGIGEMYVFDAETNKMWMKFENGCSAPPHKGLYCGANTIHVLDGVIYKGNGTNGMQKIDFVNDEIYRDSTSGRSLWVGTIGTRNTAQAEGTFDINHIIVNNTVNDVYTNVISNKTYVAVATDGGVSVINKSDGSVVNFGTTQYNGGVISNGIWLTQSRLYFSQGVSGQGLIYKIDVGSANWTSGKVLLDATDILIGTYGYSANWPNISNAVNAKNELFVTEGTSTIDGTSNTLYILTHTIGSSSPDQGMVVVQEKQSDDTNGSVKFITQDYISEEMVGDIRGMWPFYGSGSIANNTYNIDDVSVKSSELTAKNANGTGMSYVDGVRGNAISFDGVDDYLCTDTNDDGTCDDDDDLDLGTSDMTMGAWINTTYNGSTQLRIFEKEYKYMLVTDSGVMKGRIVNGSDQRWVTSSTRIDDGNWHHVVFIIDRSDTLKLYIDGVLDVTSASISDLASVDLSSTAPFNIGARTVGGLNGVFQGKIDEPFVTAEALSADQIKHMYEVGKRALENSGSDINKLGGTSATVNAVVSSGLSVRTDSSGSDHIAPNVIYAGTGDGISKIDLNSDSLVQFWNTKSDTTDPYYISNDTIGSLSASSGGGFISGTSSGVFRLNDVSGQNNLDTNKFTQITGIYDIITGYYKLYEDGLLVGKTNVGTAQVLPTNTNQVSIGSGEIPSTIASTLAISSDGKEKNTSYDNFYGAIESPQIHASVLDPRDINYMVDNKATPVLDMEFDEGHGDTVYNKNWSKVGEVTNLDEEPSFELPLRSTPNPHYTACSLGTVSRVSDVSYLGDYSLLSTSGGGQLFAQFCYVNVDINPIQKYRFSAYVKDKDYPTDGAINIMAYWTGGSNANASTNVATGLTVADIDNWTRISAVLTPDYSDRTGAYFYIRLSGGTGVIDGQGFYADNILIEPISNTDSDPVPYCDGSLSGPGEYKWNGTPNSSTSTCSYGIEGAINGASYTDGVKGTGLRFDGVSSYIDLGNNLKQNKSINQDDFTILSWFRDFDNNSQRRFIGNRNGPSEGLICGKNSGNNIECQIQDISGSSVLSVSINTYNDKKWHLFSFSRKYGDNVKVDIDGTDTTTVTDSISSIWSPINWNLGRHPTAAQYWNGDLDIIKIFPFALTSSEIKSEYNLGSSLKLGGNTGGDQSSGSDNFVNQNGSVGNGLNDNLMLHLAMNDNVSGNVQTLSDSSANGNNGTTYYGANTTGMNCTVGGKYGYGCQFDGIDDYVDVADSSTLTLSDNMAISMWIYPTSIGTAQRFLVKKHSANPWYSYYVQLDANGTVVVEWTNSAGVDYYAGTSSASPLLANQWSHVVMYKSGSDLKIYINGEDKTSWSDTPTGSILDAGSVLKIGANGTGDKEFVGTLDDIRIYNRRISDSEIDNLYLLGPEPVAQWNMDENKGGVINDTSNNSNTGTLINGPKWVPGVKGSALSFDGDGVDDHVNIADNSTIKPTSAITVSAWIASNNNATSREVYVDKRWDTITDPYNSYLIDRSGVGNNTYFQWCVSNGTSGSQTCVNDDVLPVTGQYYFITGTYDGSELKLYKDGVLVNSVAKTGAIGYSSLPLYIGSANSATLQADGIVDEVKIYNYALTPYQIAKEFNGGKPLVEYKFDEGSGQTAHNTGGINALRINSNDTTSDGALGGDTTTTTSDPTWITDTSQCVKGGCMSFDGMDDYVYDYSKNFFYKRFTFSAWVYSTNFADGLNKYVAEMWYGRPLVNVGVNGKVNVTLRNTADTGWNSYSSSNALVNGQWNHIAATFDEDTNEVKLYINGKLDGTGTHDYLGGTNASTTLSIGGRTNAWFSGKIDEVRLFDYALSPEDVAREYNMGASVKF